jgi:hypothetical protein
MQVYNTLGNVRSRYKMSLKKHVLMPRFKEFSETLPTNVSSQLKK